DKSGNIRKPPDTRDLYQLLGTYLVADPNAEEMHVTYASPGAAEYYRKNGKFADGTVLAKETLATDHAPMTTGYSHWAKSTQLLDLLAEGGAAAVAGKAFRAAGLLEDA